MHLLFKRAVEDLDLPLAKLIAPLAKGALEPWFIEELHSSLDRSKRGDEKGEAMIRYLEALLKTGCVVS